MVLKKNLLISGTNLKVDELNPKLDVGRLIAQRSVKLQSTLLHLWAGVCTMNFHLKLAFPLFCTLFSAVLFIECCSALSDPSFFFTLLRFFLTPLSLLITTLILYENILVTWGFSYSCREDSVSRSNPPTPKGIRKKIRIFFSKYSIFIYQIRGIQMKKRKLVAFWWKFRKLSLQEFSNFMTTYYFKSNVMFLKNIQTMLVLCSIIPCR